MYKNLILKIIPENLCIIQELLFEIKNLQLNEFDSRNQTLIERVNTIIKYQLEHKLLSKFINLKVNKQKNKVNTPLQSFLIENGSFDIVVNFVFNDCETKIIDHNFSFLIKKSINNKEFIFFINENTICIENNELSKQLSFFEKTWSITIKNNKIHSFQYDIASYLEKQNTDLIQYIYDNIKDPHLKEILLLQYDIDVDKIEMYQEILYSINYLLTLKEKNC